MAAKHSSNFALDDDALDGARNLINDAIQLTHAIVTLAERIRTAPLDELEELPGVCLKQLIIAAAESARQRATDAYAIVDPEAVKETTS